MGRRKDPSDQLTLFAPPPDAELEEPEDERVGPAPITLELEDLGQALHPEIRLGPSTWSFPGWAGIVYDRKYTPTRLAHEGLAALAQHPLLRAAGVDRTHYAPIPAADFAAYAEVVPAGFRFLVKAHEALTLSRFPDRPRYGRDRGLGNPLYLDPSYAAEAVVGPYVEGLQEKGGALLFQFAPQDLGGPARFADELGAFLAALPRGPLYAVELRNRELLIPRYAEALAAAGAVHCINAHPRMPDVRTQAALTDLATAPALVVRWLLGPGETYEDAGKRFAPFDRLQEEDVHARRGLAALSRESIARHQSVLITVNNNAEGSAPLSIERLAAEIVRGDESAG
jgi:uncharacterized protein YecE (DUF72 family)